MISDIFIARPRLAFVVSVVMVLAGLIALTRIPVAQYPDIVPPQVTVTTTYPGASATTVESSVAEPIEAYPLGGIEGRHALAVAQSRCFGFAQGQRRDVVQRGLDRKQVFARLGYMPFIGNEIQ